MSLTYEKTENPLVYDTRKNKVIYYQSKVYDIDNPTEEEEEEEKITVPNKYIGHLELIPRSGKVKGHENDILYITGSSGAGKTYVARTFACNYHRVFPKNRIYYFTMSDESKLPDSEKIFMAKIRDNEIRYNEWLHLIRYHVDKTLLNKKFDLEKDFANSLVIFDDFLYFQTENKKDNETLMNYLVGLLTKIMNLGRKIRVSCVITSHLIYEQRHPDLYRNIFGETHKFIWGSNHINERQLDYALKTHFGLSKSEVKKARRFDPNSHYVCFSKYPRYLQSENKLELLA
jgi:hypothetical protein